jgi:hypothetical protein
MLLLNGALKIWGEPPQELEIVNVPVAGGLLILRVPDRLYKLLAHAVGLAVNPVTPQTNEQSADPVPPV